MQIIHSKNLSEKPSSTMSQAPYPPGGYAYGPGQGYQQPGYYMSCMTSGTKLRHIWAYWDWLRPIALCKILFVLPKKSVNGKPFLVSSDCALACAVALVANFRSRSTRKFLDFSQKSSVEHPGFHRLRALGSLQFFLEHSYEWFLFTYQNFLNCHQTSKMPSRTFWRQPKNLHCFVRQQNAFFLGLPWQLSFIGACYFAKITNLTEIIEITENFACLRCEQGCKNKILEISCKRHLNSIFSRSVNRVLCKNLIYAALLISELQVAGYLVP